VIRRPLHQFIGVWRNFGLLTATRVAYSKLRGLLWPSLALPTQPKYEIRREVSFLLSTAEHDPAVLQTVVHLLAKRGDARWEVCISEHSPTDSEMAGVLARVRGTQPWIRIVTMAENCDPETATRWTMEQATGEFVALLGRKYIPEAKAVAGLLGRLRDDPAIGAAAVVGPEPLSTVSPSPSEAADCLLLVQRKSAYLSAFSGERGFAAPEAARGLAESGVATAYVACTELTAARN
jgi:hypothetical protein